MIEPVSTYTPMLWVTLNEDEKYAEYIRVRTLLSSLQEYVGHKSECAKWGPVWEWPRHLHADVACTCGLPKL